MIPILYEAGETSFTTNGVGRLADATYCTVSEQRNGEYALEMDIPVTSKMFPELAEGRFIYAEPRPGGTRQAFEIKKIEAPINGIVSVYAPHISYRLNGIVSMPFTASTCALALNGLKTNAADTCPFTFWTDKSASGTFTVKAPQGIRSLLGGQQGSILDVFGTGEYEFDMYDVKLYQKRGSDRGVHIRYGKNLQDLTDSSDATNVYTGIVPFYSNDLVTVTLPEKAVWGEHVDAYPYRIAKPVDFSSQFETAPTVAQLRAAANTYVNASTGWQINSNLRVKFVALSDTEEYKDSNIQRVNLCDTVTVVTELGEEVSAKVVSVVYDVLAERYTSIELGSASTSLGQAISDEIMEVVPTRSIMQEAIANGTRLITGGLGGYVILKPNANGQPEELLVMDNQDYTKAVHIWRFNKNGIGFSKEGYEGEFKQAWTIDGRFYTDWVTAGQIDADLVRTGSIVAERGSMTIDLDNGTITLGNKALRITAGNFKLSADGDVTLTGTISNGKTSLNSSKNGIYIGTDGISIGTFKGADASSTGFKATDGGTVTLGGVRFFLPNGREAQHGLWAKNGGTHIGSGGPCDFNSEGDGTANKRNYLRNGTTLFGGVDVYAGMWMSGDLRFDTAHDYMIDDVNEIYASGKITCEQVIQTSDERRKEEITDLEKAEEFILALRPVRFKFKERDGYHHGFIAQEVQKALQDENDIVTEDKHGMLGLSYTEIIADLVGICQKQQQRINDLEQRLASIEALLEGDGK